MAENGGLSYLYASLVPMHMECRPPGGGGGGAVNDSCIQGGGRGQLTHAYSHTHTHYIQTLYTHKIMNE